MIKSERKKKHTEEGGKKKITIEQTYKYPHNCVQYYNFHFTVIIIVNIFYFNITPPNVNISTNAFHSNFSMKCITHTLNTMKQQSRNKIKQKKKKKGNKKMRKKKRACYQYETAITPRTNECANQCASVSARDKPTIHREKERAKEGQVTTGKSEMIDGGTHGTDRRCASVTFGYRGI